MPLFCKSEEKKRRKAEKRAEKIAREWQSDRHAAEVLAWLDQQIEDGVPMHKLDMRKSETSIPETILT